MTSGRVNPFIFLYNRSGGPMTLYDMLGRKQIPGTTSKVPLPTLAQRFRLAASLGQTLYSFMLADWHHKLFNSLNIMFLPSTITQPSSAATSSSQPDVTCPFVCGFSISRTSAPEEISITSTTPVTEAYLHPDLRVRPPQKRPRYTVQYEIYSFGLLLAEIGFWQPVARLSGSASTGSSSSSSHRKQGPPPAPEQCQQARLAKCRQDLACWMGDEYAAVTLQCLEVGPQSPRAREKMAFYEMVIWELDQCAERMRLPTAGPL
jgi:hypothetical protein